MVPSAMKRIGIALSLMAVVLLTSFAWWLFRDPNRPRFVPGRFPVSIGSYDYVSYEFLSPRPFEGDRTWISVRRGTNEFHAYLFDLQGRSIVGELKNALPIITGTDGSQVLCMRRYGPAQGAIRRRITTLIEALSRGRIRFPGSDDDTETFWVVDLQRHSGVRLGQVTQLRGAGSSFIPSPGLRYAYNKPTGSLRKPEFFVCDLEARAFRRVALDGWPQEWWDEKNVIVKTTNNDFVLYNVITRTNAGFLSAAAIRDFATRMALVELDPGKANLFSVWNGTQNVFYLTDTHKRWLAGESYLVRLERPGPVLRLVTNGFKFEWSDHIDPGGKHYVYSGRESGEASSAVFLRDLETGLTRTLVPDDGAKQFSMPAFYADTIIYSRSNALWQIGLGGLNGRRLFPSDN
jgi:hypothetical protein